MSQKNLWSDLSRRLTVLAIGIPFVGCMLYQPLTAWLFFQGVHLLASWEWLHLVPPSAQSVESLRRIKYVFPLLSLALANIRCDKLFAFFLSIGACFFSMLAKENSQHFLKGLLFLTLPFRAWNDLCLTFPVTVYLLAIVWNCDNGALLIGRLSRGFYTSRNGVSPFPHPRWLSQISPAKSFEGMVGGLLGGCLTSVAWPWVGMQFSSDHYSHNFPFDPSTINIQQRLLYGFILSVLSVLGDLWESSVKREANAKDSGTLLPGHGGVLDRFDSSLLPALFYHSCLQC